MKKSLRTDPEQYQRFMDYEDLLQNQLPMICNTLFSKRRATV